MYFETGSSTTASTLAFTIATTGGGSWRIKVSQIECKNPGRAPFDCLQYFTGRGGNIKSINFDGGVQLQNIAYTICIRQELGYCGIEYRAQDGTSPDTFDLSDASAVAANVRHFWCKITYSISDLNCLFSSTYLNSLGRCHSYWRIYELYHFSWKSCGLLQWNSFG